MQSHKKLVKRKDVEQLENTSLAAVGLLVDQGAMDVCAVAYYSCYCETTVVQCCDSSTVCVAAGTTGSTATTFTIPTIPTL